MERLPKGHSTIPPEVRRLLEEARPLEEVKRLYPEVCKVLTATGMGGPSTPVVAAQEGRARLSTSAFTSQAEVARRHTVATMEQSFVDWRKNGKAKRGSGESVQKIRAEVAANRIKALPETTKVRRGAIKLSQEKVATWRKEHLQATIQSRNALLTALKKEFTEWESGEREYYNFEERAALFGQLEGVIKEKFEAVDLELESITQEEREENEKIQETIQLRRFWEEKSKYQKNLGKYDAETIERFAGDYAKAIEKQIDKIDQSASEEALEEKKLWQEELEEVKNLPQERKNAKERRGIIQEIYTLIDDVKNDNQGALLLFTHEDIPSEYRGSVEVFVEKTIPIAQRFAEALPTEEDFQNDKDILNQTIDALDTHLEEYIKAHGEDFYKEEMKFTPFFTKFVAEVKEAIEAKNIKQAKSSNVKEFAKVFEPFLKLLKTKHRGAEALNPFERARNHFIRLQNLVERLEDNTTDPAQKERLGAHKQQLHGYIDNINKKKEVEETEESEIEWMLQQTRVGRIEGGERERFVKAFEIAEKWVNPNTELLSRLSGQMRKGRALYLGIKMEQLLDKPERSEKERLDLNNLFVQAQAIAENLRQTKSSKLSETLEKVIERYHERDLDPATREIRKNFMKTLHDLSRQARRGAAKNKDKFFSDCERCLQLIDDGLVPDTPEVKNQFFIAQALYTLLRLEELCEKKNKNLEDLSLQNQCYLEMLHLEPQINRQKSADGLKRKFLEIKELYDNKDDESSAAHAVDALYQEAETGAASSETRYMSVFESTRTLLDKSTDSEKISKKSIGKRFLVATILYTAIKMEKLLGKKTRTPEEAEELKKTYEESIGLKKAEVENAEKPLRRLSRAMERCRELFRKRSGKSLSDA